jgi:hypothetical protein
MKLLSTLLLIFICACGSSKSWNPEVKKAVYIRQYCVAVKTVKAGKNWSEYSNGEVFHEAGKFYQCPNIDNQIFLGDDEIQPTDPQVIYNQ